MLKNLSEFAIKYKSLPCLAYTHLQPAQLTTVGKRATLWMYELSQDMDNLDYQLANLKLLGSKGTTARRQALWSFFRAMRKRLNGLKRL